MNRVKTVLFLTILTVLLIFIGGLLGGRNGMMIAFVLAAILNFSSYWFSDKIVLTVYRAKPLDPNSNHPADPGGPQSGNPGRTAPAQSLYYPPRKARMLSPPDGIPIMPPWRPPREFLDILDDDELEGVMAHELSHVKHYDILIGSIAATIAGAISILASMARWAAIFGGGRGDDDDGGGIVGLIVMTIIAPIAALIVQSAVSRSREFMADKGGAELSKKPLALASALEKLHHQVQRKPMQASAATAHMFIVNPLTAKSMLALFSTHPPVEKRIEKLRGMTYGS